MAQLLDRAVDQQTVDEYKDLPGTRPGGLIHRTSSQALGLVAAAALLVGVTVASVAFGAKPIPFATVFDALFHYSPALHADCEDRQLFWRVHAARSNGRPLGDCR